MTHLPYQPEAEKVGEYLGYVVNDRRHTKKRRCTAVILQMPEQEGENQTNPEAHEPGYKQEGGAF